MTKLLGGWMVALGCSYLGYLKGQELKKSAHFIGEFLVALAFMKRELEQYHRPLPDLIGEIGSWDGFGVSGFFRNVQKELELDEKKCLGEIWEESLDKSGDISPNMVEIMSALGGVLGKYSAKRQGEGIEAVCDQLMVLRQEQEVKFKGLSRVYGATGVCGGLFLVIFLM